MKSSAGCDVSCSLQSHRAEGLPGREQERLWFAESPRALGQNANQTDECPQVPTAALLPCQPSPRGPSLSK